MGLKQALKRIGNAVGADVEAVEQESKERALAMKMEQLKRRGYDTCKLCGYEVPVYIDDSWDDVLERLEEHGQEQDDHVKDPEEGWILVE